MVGNLLKSLLFQVWNVQSRHVLSHPSEMWNAMTEITRCPVTRCHRANMEKWNDYPFFSLCNKREKNLVNWSLTCICAQLLLSQRQGTNLRKKHYSILTIEKKLKKTLKTFLAIFLGIDKRKGKELFGESKNILSKEELFLLLW